jgi:predicted small metal-binding protein
MQSREAGLQWQVTCVCGWRVRGAKEEVIKAVQEHGRSVHGLETSEDEVMALAVPA